MNMVTPEEPCVHEGKFCGALALRTRGVPGGVGAGHKQLRNHFQHASAGAGIVAQCSVGTQL